MNTTTDVQCLACGDLRRDDQAEQFTKCINWDCKKHICNKCLADRRVMKHFCISCHICGDCLEKTRGEKLMFCNHCGTKRCPEKDSGDFECGILIHCRCCGVDTCSSCDDTGGCACSVDYTDLFND